MKIQWNVKTKLITTFSAILVIPSLLTGIYSYTTAKEEVKGQIVQNASENVKLLNKLINNTFEPKMKDMEFFTKNVNRALHTQNSQEVMKKFNQYMGLHPEALSVYIGTDTGKMILAPVQELPKDFDPRKRPWYEEAMKNKGKSMVTEPYADAGTGQIIVTIARSLEDGSGVAAVDITIDKLTDITKQIKIGYDGYAFMSDQNHKVVIHPAVKIGEKMEYDWVDKLYSQNEGTFEYTFEGKTKEMQYVTNELTHWKVAGAFLEDEIGKRASIIFNKTLMIILLSFLIGGVFLYFLMVSIFKPLRKLVEVSSKVSEGDLTQTMEVKGKDEFGRLGQSFNHMIDSLQTILGKANDTAVQVASSSEELTASAEQTSHAAEQIATAIQDIAHDAETQDHISKNSANEIQNMTETVERGNVSIQKTIEQMNSISATVGTSAQIIEVLGQRSQEIEQIVEAITDISEQTNLLALNAAIEAARAGEQGKGFAVVAEEVRKLAEQSEKSAKQIADLIKTIQKDTHEAIVSMRRGTEEVGTGIQLVGHAGEEFKNILTSAESVSKEIGKLIEISQKTSNNIQHVASSSEEQLSTMEEITSSSNALSQMAGELQHIIKQFKI